MMYTADDVGCESVPTFHTHASETIEGTLLCNAPHAVVALSVTTHHDNINSDTHVNVDMTPYCDSDTHVTVSTVTCVALAPRRELTCRRSLERLRHFAMSFVGSWTHCKRTLTLRVACPRSNKVRHSLVLHTHTLQELLPRVWSLGMLDRPSKH